MPVDLVMCILLKLETIVFPKLETIVFQISIKRSGSVFLSSCYHYALFQKYVVQ